MSKVSVGIHSLLIPNSNGLSFFNLDLSLGLSTHPTYGGNDGVVHKKDGAYSTWSTLSCCQLVDFSLLHKTVRKLNRIYGPFFGIRTNPPNINPRTKIPWTKTPCANSPRQIFLMSYLQNPKYTF